MTKKCFKCGTVKDTLEFYRKTASKDGLQGHCKSCKTNYNKAHYIDNIESYKSRRVAWRETNGRQWQLHNIPEDTFKIMVSKYDGKCWICQTKDFSHVDHDHGCCSGHYSCGRCVRGLLCTGCNTALGKLGDTVDSLKKAMVYLENANE